MQAETLQNENIADQASEYLRQEDAWQAAQNAGEQGVADEAAEYLRWQDTLHSDPEYIKKRDDAATLAAETVDGKMYTEFSFHFDGKDLYGRGGQSMTKVFRDSTADAIKNAEINPEMAFEVPRRLIEEGELGDMFAMVRGELPNTMIVESELPHALHAATKNIGGYNVFRKQTMQRVITYANNTITIRSQTLDRSDRDGLEAIYRHLGFEPGEGELLGQRMHLNLNSKEQDALNDELIGVYDGVLIKKHGGEWHAGRTPADTANTYDFVTAQDDLLDAFVYAFDDNSPDQVKDSLRYQLAAAMEARWEGTMVRGTFTPSQEMWLAGIEAELKGKTYSGCGLTLDTASELSELGYGNKDGYSCPFCNKYQKGDPCAANKKCKNKECEAEVRGNKVVYEGHGNLKARLGKFLADTLLSGPELN